MEYDFNTMVALDILVGHDLSKRADQALRRALLIAGPDCRVTVVSAAQSAQTVDRSQALLAWRLGYISGWDACRNGRVIVEAGEPADVVTRVAERLRSNLVVIGMHRKGGLLDHMQYVTAARIIRAARLPVLVATRGPLDPYRRIVVGMDYTRCAVDALGLVLVWFAGAGVRVVHALEVRQGRRPLMPGAYSEIEKARKAWLSELVEDVSARIDPQPERARVVSSLLHGAPAACIEAVAKRENADLVVIGTQAKSSIVHFFLGSVAERLLADPPADLLVVPAAMA
jgi:nucleotide-binding universal stress UspA family protein